MLDAAVDLLRSSLAGNDWFRGVDVVAAAEGPVIRVHVATGSEPIVPTHIEGIPVVIARAHVIVPHAPIPSSPLRRRPQSAITQMS